MQVPSSELTNWQKALAKRDNVSYKMYPDLIHLLVNYKGEPNFSEYNIPANVPEEFIHDIANWVKDGQSSLSFSDVKDGFWAYKEIQFMVNKGYISGYADGTFRPNELLNRAQMASIVATAFHLKGQPAKPFSDVRKDHWAAKPIDALAANGIALGNSNGTFGPNQQVTRAQAAAFLYRASTK